MTLNKNGVITQNNGVIDPVLIRSEGDSRYQPLSATCQQRPFQRLRQRGLQAELAGLL